MQAIDDKDNNIPRDPNEQQQQQQQQLQQQQEEMTEDEQHEFDLPETQGGVPMNAAPDGEAVGSGATARATATGGEGIADAGRDDNDKIVDDRRLESPLTSRRPVDARNDDDDEDGNSSNGNGDDEFAIPATPMQDSANRNNNNNNNNNLLGATPGTPLTPLSDLGGSGGVRSSRGRVFGRRIDDDDDDDDGSRRGGNVRDGVAANLRFDEMHGPNDGDFNNRDDDDDELLDGDATNLNAPRGTDIDVHVAATTFRDFLRNFPNGMPGARANRRQQQHLRQRDDMNPDSETDDDLDDEEDDLEDTIVEPIYLAKLRETLNRTTQGSLDIDTEHLYRYNKKLYQQMVSFPMDIIPLMDIVVQREMKRLRDAEADQDGNDDATQYPLPIVQVRPYRLHSQQVANLRQLDPEAIDTLIAIRGMIVRSSPIIPDLKVAHFTCCICGNDQQVRIDRGRIQEPRQCPQCNTKDSYQLQHNRCIFADKQLVRLQETPDQVPAGQTPASVFTFCFDDLVDACQPGDKVEVTGVLRAQPVRIHPRVTKVKSVYKTYVDVIHFRTINGMESKSSNTNGAKMVTKISADRIEELKRLSQQPDIYEQLTRSLAPSIWELDNVKKGVLCMLFGGNTKRVRNRRNNNRNGRVHRDDEWTDDEVDEDEDGDAEDTKLNKRGDINILLCGDPGTSKSQLLSYVHKLSSRGIYTSGKGSSAVGLTASVVRDPETKDLVLESGALVLSDRGICCIDEFDKMTDATRSILHEAMEQQTVSIAKAGIISSLNARTSILASANPVESRYNPNLSVVENIRLPPTLLSRFDLIYLILDSPNVESDRQLAKHLVGLYYETPNVVQPPMSTDLLRDYIDYARENIFPRLSDEATDELLKSYLELRNPPGGNVGNNGSRTISATPRQLESLIRTSEALAKMRYSSEVTRADAREAVRLLKVATQAAATDPRTGRIDMDMINTGRTSVERENEESLYEGLKEYLLERRGNRLSVRDVARQLGEISGNPVPQDDVVAALRRLDADGAVQFNERNQTVFARTGVV